MSNNATSLFEESINLELNVSDLYFIFYTLFSEDSEFWWDLVLEEKAHAAIFRSGKEVLSQLEMFPHNLLHHNLQGLKDANSALLSLIKTYKHTPPSREEAFNIALKIETSAAELHLQDVLHDKADSEIVNFFKKLNKGDKDHAIRIQSYMEKHDISIKSE